MTEDRSRPTVRLTVDPNSVAAPVHRAAMACREVVDFYFHALSKADLSNPPPGVEASTFRFQMESPNLSADSRRSLHESWILAKAFQDLMRGARASLEQADFIIDLTSRRHSVPSSSTIEDLTSPILEKAGKRSFPDLLARVNAKLQQPLEFASAYESMQKARNCLEHRGGIVGRPDVGTNDNLELSFPRLKLFYMRHGEEIEIELGKPVNADDGKPEVEIFARFAIRQRSYKPRERLSLTVDDFNEIAFACYHFGSLFVARLPTPATDQRSPGA